MLFSASRDQYRYFSKLIGHLSLPISLKHYKYLWFPELVVQIPRDEIAEQVELLVTRKSNTEKGQKKSALYWKIFRWLNQKKAHLLYRQYAAWLKRLDASFIGVWNGKKFRQSILVIAAHHFQKQLIFFERGPLPGYSCVDPKGVNAFSSIPRSADFYKKRDVVSANSEKNLAEPENYIFVPLQVVEDSNIYLHSPWIKNMRHLYDVLEQCIKDNPALHFVLKPHPACSEQYQDLIHKSNPNIVWETQKTSSELVAKSKAVLTINSTVGIEALMAHKKVLVLGDALYGFEPLVRLAKDQKCLQDILRKIDDLKVDDLLIEQFLDYLKTDYAIPEDAMRSPGSEHWRIMEAKLNLILNDQAELALGLNGK